MSDYISFLQTLGTLAGGFHNSRSQIQSFIDGSSNLLSVLRVAPGTSSNDFADEWLPYACPEVAIVIEGSNIWMTYDSGANWTQLTSGIAGGNAVGDYKFAARRTDISNIWLRCDGRTVGSATSGGTARANDDMQTLFEHLWDNFTNTELVIQTSGGVPTTRGASAAIDFAANKRMPLPDMRGRIALMLDDPTGASAANRVTSAQADLLGGSLGAETHTLTISEMPAHSHNAIQGLLGAGGGGFAAGASGAANISPEGGGNAHNNMQPSFAGGVYLIYTGN